MRRIGPILTLVIALAACGSNTTSASPGATTLPKADPNVVLARQGEPGPLPAKTEVQAAARGEEAFGLALYGQVASGKGNLAIAPSSIATVLGMVAAGAKGATREQIVDALRVQVPAAELHTAIGGLVRTLAARSGGDVSLAEVDQAWVQQKLTLLDGFAGTLTRDYAAPIARIDFTDTNKAATTINAWVSPRTHGKIPTLITPDALDQAELVLTDAVYLDAKWEHGFDPKLTNDQPFRLTDGSSVSVPTMHRTAELGMARGDGWTAVALPYKSNVLEMDIVVPDDLAQFEKSLDAATFDRIVSSMKSAGVALDLPKFEFRARFENLKAALGRLGVRDAFDADRADFSAMTSTAQLYLSSVVHEAFVHVDEQGTVAAAATGGVMNATAAEVVTPIKVDKPFVFAVRDRATGAIVFLGRVTDPRALRSASDCSACSSTSSRR